MSWYDDFNEYEDTMQQQRNRYTRSHTLAFISLNDFEPNETVITNNSYKTLKLHIPEESYSLNRSLDTYSSWVVIYLTQEDLTYLTLSTNIKYETITHEILEQLQNTLEKYTKRLNRATWFE